MGLYGQVVRPKDEALKQLLRQFVLVRVVYMNEVDIARFQFDYDLVFAVLFTNSHGEVYSRYGSRTQWNATSRISLTGLKRNMQKVLAVHKQSPRPSTRRPAPQIAGQVAGIRGGCMHCHQAWEGLRWQARQAGKFDINMFYVYPQPKRIGLRLDVDEGNRVVAVSKGSAAERAGLQIADVITRIGKHTILSQADATWALHNAPTSGTLEIQFTRAGKQQAAQLILADGWKRKTKLTWRASMRNEELPSKSK